MKKSYIFAAAAVVAAAMVGCATDDAASQAGAVGGAPSDAVIGFMPSTTRADEVILSTLISDTEGLPIYAVEGDDPTAFFIGGDKVEYNATSKLWKWSGTTHKWPTATTSYPMTFYSYYPATDDSWTVAMAEGTPRSLRAEVTIQEADKQTDLLSAIKSSSVRPVGGMLPLTYEHILSRVVFNITTVDDIKVYVQRATMNDLDSVNTYDFMANAWETLVPQTDKADYDYLLPKNPALVVATASTTLDAAETAYEASYNNLMLLPQAFTVWDGTTTIAGARVEVIYRTMHTNGEDQIGYEMASSHPDYAKADQATRPAADDKLFIKIGLPLATPSQDASMSDDTWYNGLQYTYNLKLGATDSNNGYLIDKYYYDQDGNKTTLEVKNVEIGDEVTSGDMCFDVTVGGWGSNTSYDL